MLVMRQKQRYRITRPESWRRRNPSDIAVWNSILQTALRLKTMINLRLFEDDWQGVRSQDTEYQCESPEQIREALSKLNGKNKTIVALIVDDDHHLTVGGGNDGRYVCYVTSGNQILNLKNAAAGKGTERVRIVAGCQAGEFPVDLCVDLRQVRSAAEYYSETGKPNPALVWEPAQ